MRKTLGFVLALLIFVPSAWAQTGFGLLAKPWLDDTSYELDNADGLFQSAGHERNEPGHVDLFQANSDGRARFSVPGVADGQKFLFAGYDVNYIDLPSHGHLLPNRLFDGSVGFGMGLGKWDNNILAFSGGVGYAGDNPFAQSSAVYGKGDLILAHQLGEDRYLVFGLDYDGNRTALPDVPLPGIAYRAKNGDTLAYIVGFPYSSVEWRPWKPVTVTAEYTIPDSFDVTVGYRPVRQWVIFGGYHNLADGFHIDDTKETRRLFFQQQRIEAGVTWIPVDNVELTVAGGYAFDQRFDSGFDTLDLNSITPISDEPFARIGATVRF